MKKQRSFVKSNCLLAVILSLAASLNAFSQEFSLSESPLGAPTSPVMDYAGVMDAAAKQSLEKRIIEFRDRTNPKVELAVAIVKTTGDRPIFEYSLAVSRGWKIGSKEDDNPSALLFIAVDDRKYFTQVSKDLQDELPDGVVGQLQRQNLVPAFRQNDYSKGVTDTVEAYIRTIESKGNVAQQPEINETTPPTGRTRGRVSSRSSLSGICCLVIAFFVILAFLSRSSRRGGGGDNNRWRGGGGGFGGGGSVLPWVIGSVIANSVSNSSSSGWGSSSSGDWGGGGSGGDSWGGFGGGGDFDGGGAGGDW